MFTKRNDAVKISIIIAVRNGVDTLQRCIDSITEQIFPSWEIIVMDGDSDDGSISLLRANEQYITYWETKKDRGIYHAWNKSLGHAKGEWIIFLGADDYFKGRGVLDEIVRYLDEALKENVRIVYGMVDVVDKFQLSLGKYGKPWGDTKSSFMELMTIPHQGVFHHHSLFKLNGMFDEAYIIAGDYELMLRELKKGRAIFVPLVVSGMQYGGISSNPEHALLALLEIKHAGRRHNVGNVRLRWNWVYFKAYIRCSIGSVIGLSRVKYLSNLYRMVTNRKPIK